MVQDNKRVFLNAFDYECAAYRCIKNILRQYDVTILPRGKRILRRALKHVEHNCNILAYAEKAGRQYLLD